MGVTPPLRYIHIDDYSPVGIDNGPDDIAFANARADLAATGYRKLVVGQKQYWLQNGFNLNGYTDFAGIQYPQLNNVLITSDNFVGSKSGQNRIFCGLPATIILSPGFADPTAGTYAGGSEPCRTTGSIKLADSCGLTNLRIMSLAAYNLSRLAAAGLEYLGFTNQVIWGLTQGMAAPVGNADGLLHISAGGGTGIQIDGDYCYVDKLFILGFRNSIVCVPTSANGNCGAGPVFGWIKTDAANGIRVDNCNQAGAIIGPIENQGYLTVLLSKGFDAATLVSDGNGGTSVSFAPKDPSSFVVGNAFKVLLQSTTTSAACFNAFNTGNLTPAGAPSNRFDGVVSSSSISTGTVVLDLAGIPVTAFFDASCNSVGSGTGTLSGSESLGYTLVTALSSGILAPGQFVVAPGIPNPTSISETVGTATSTGTTCLLSTSGSATMTAGSTITLAGVQQVVGSISTGTSTGLGVPTLTLNSASISTALIEPNQLLTGPGVLPGTIVESTTGTPVTSCTLSAPQLVGPSIAAAFSGAVITGSITGSLLTDVSTLVGEVEVGQLVTGPGIPEAITITGTSGGKWDLSSTLTTNIKNATLNLLASPSTATASSLTCSGTTTKLTLSSGSLTSLQGLYGNGILPGSFIESGGSATCTVGVGLAIGSPSNPVEILAQPAAVVFGTITSPSGSLVSTLTVGSTVSGVLEAGYPIFGPGITEDTYIASGSLTTYLLNNFQDTPPATEQLLVAVRGVAAVGSIAGTVLSVSAVSPTAGGLLANQLLAGATILPGTSITGALSSGTGPGLYAVSVGQNVATASTQQNITAVPSAVIQGSISGTTLNVAPFGSLTVGALLSGTSLSSGTTIASVLSASGTTASYTFSPHLSAAATEAMTAVSIGAIVTASIGGAPGSGPTNSMVITNTAFGTPAVGQQVVGPTVSEPTYIESISGATLTLNNAWLTGSETFTLATPTGATFTGSISSTSGIGTLNVQSVSSGILGIGQTVVGGGIPSTQSVFITSPGSLANPGTGGAGNYLLSSSGSLGTVASGMMASFPALNSFIGTVTGAGSVYNTLTIAQPTLIQGATLLGSGILAGTTLSTVGTLGASNLVDTFQNVGSVLSPETITLYASATSTPSSFSFSGYISNTVLTAPSLSSSDTLAVGCLLIAPGILPGTVISQAGTISTVATVSVPQNAVVAPFTASAASAVLSGSIFGTTLAASVLGSLSSTGTILTGQNIPIGTSITSSSGATGSVTCALSVPQYQPSGALTLASAGSLIACSLSGTTMSVANDTIGSSLSVGDIISGENIALGTNIVSNAGSYVLAAPQPSGTSTFSLLNPMLSSSETLLPTVGIRLSSLGPRPGRLIEMNNASSFGIGQVQCFDDSTAIRLIDSSGIHINESHSDCSGPDSNTTFFDVQGTSADVIVNASGFVNISTFMNNDGAAASTALASNVGVNGCSGGVSLGGTILSQSGTGVHFTGSDFGHGSFVLWSAEPVSFSATAFAPGAVGIPAPTFAYGPGVPFAVFDPSCQNAPNPANSFASPLTTLAGSLSAAIGGLGGSDFGRTGYLVLPSAADFATVGDRQAAFTLLGAVSTTNTATTLTADGNGANSVNSIPAQPRIATFGQGYLVAYNNAAGHWAAWPNVTFLLTPTEVTEAPSLTVFTGANITAPYYSDSISEAWTFDLTLGPDNSVSAVTSTGSIASTYTVHWLFGVYCLDVG